MCEADFCCDEGFVLAFKDYWTKERINDAIHDYSRKEEQCRKCKHCGSSKTVGNGRDRNGKQRIRCKDCGRTLAYFQDSQAGF